MSYLLPVLIKTGQTCPQTIATIDPSMVDAVACIIKDHEQKPEVVLIILDCSESEINVVREGAFSIDRIKEIS